MVVSARPLHLRVGVCDSFRWLGSKWESFLAQEPRASCLPIPQPTPGVVVGVDGVSAVTHTTTCSGRSIIKDLWLPFVLFCKTVLWFSPAFHVLL